jgi:hypothetical protein
MTLPYGSSRVVVPLWIIAVGVVAAFSPVPGVAVGVGLVLACLIVVPVVITRLL